MVVLRSEGNFAGKAHGWFQKRNKFWTLMSFVSLASLISLQAIMLLQEESNPHVRQGIDSIVIPLLILFILSIFWRGFIPAFLSHAGAISTYYGIFYVYAKSTSFAALPTFFANKAVPEVKILANPSVHTVASFFFLIGIFALTLSIAIALRPTFFHARGARFRQPYEIWPGDTAYGKQLIPVSGLLSDVECELVKRYRYIVMVIGGRMYFVSPDDWVPEGSSVVRDRESGSLVGIPKVSDGFNVW
jgi:hypothetical protein